MTLTALQSSPREASQYEPFPATAGDPKSYERWKKDFASWLGRTKRLEIWRSPSLEEQSRSGESERDFRIRLQQLAHERRDNTSARLRQKYAPKLRTIQERIRRAEQAKARQAEQANQQYVQTAISVGSALLGAFLGRKTISSTTIGRAASAARGAGRSIKETKDVARAEENLDSLRKQLAEVESQFEQELSATLQKIDPATESLEQVSIRPTKGNVQVKLLALAWVPYWLDESDVKTAAY